MKVSRSDIRKSFLKRPENWVNFLALATAIILGYRSLTSGQENDYLQAVLAVLGILAGGQLVVSYSSVLRDQEIQDLSGSIDMLVKSQVTAHSFFRTRETLSPWSWESRVKGAKTVDVFGLSLVSLGLTNNAVLRHLKESGATIRMLVSNPENQSLQDAIAARIGEVQTTALHADLVRNVISTVDRIAQEPGGSGSLQIKASDYLPLFGYIGTDVSQPHGLLSIELYLTKSPVNKNPIFPLDATSDPLWFNVFKNQFEFLWTNAKDVKTGPTKSA